MEWWEVNRYLAGIRRRHHDQWETTRWTIAHLANMFREKGRPPFKPQDVVKFPWEKDETTEQTITDEEIAEMQAEMDAWNMANQKQEAPDES